MKYLGRLALLVGILTSTYGNAQDAIPPDPRVEQIVEELELPRAATAMRDNPNWRPQRIVASVPGLAGLGPMLRGSAMLATASDQMVQGVAGELQGAIEQLLR